VSSAPPSVWDEQAAEVDQQLIEWDERPIRFDLKEQAQPAKAAPVGE
jgi:hypothetical protein